MALPGTFHLSLSDIRLRHRVLVCLFFLASATHGSPTAPVCCPNGGQPDEHLLCDGTPADLPCPLHSADIKHVNTVSILSDGRLSVDSFIHPNGSYCLLNDLVYYCPCFSVPCIRKCCDEDSSIERNASDHFSCQVLSVFLNRSWLPPLEEKGMPHHILYDRFPECDNGMYKVREPYFISTSGMALTNDSTVIATPMRYCLEVVDDEKDVSLFACRLPTYERPKLLYSVLFVIGSFFLFLTLVFHLSLCYLGGSVHSKNMTNHLSTLLVAFVTLTVLSFGYNPDNHILCSGIAFVVQFSMLAAFFWLNVMSIDIAWSFSNHRSPAANNVGDAATKKYLYYSIYVWTASSAVVVLTAIAEWQPFESLAFLSPHFGGHRCWFSTKLPAFVFFYFPTCVLLIMNVFLFIFTTIKVRSAKKNAAELMRNGTITRRKDKHHNIHEIRFMLYLKLFLLMGITWIFDVISWVMQDDKYIFFYITDGINALRGLFIFILFCVKKKTMNQIVSKVSCLSRIQAAIENRKLSFQRGLSCSTTSTRAFST